MTISQMLLPEFDQEMANTRKLLERVPELGVRERAGVVAEPHEPDRGGIADRVEVEVGEAQPHPVEHGPEKEHQDEQHRGQREPQPGARLPPCERRAHDGRPAAPAGFLAR